LVEESKRVLNEIPNISLEEKGAESSDQQAADQGEKKDYFYKSQKILEVLHDKEYT